MSPIRAWLARYPLRRPFVYGGRVVEARVAVLVRVEVEGHVGWGEAAPLPGFRDGDPVRIARACLGARLHAVARDAAELGAAIDAALAATPVPDPDVATWARTALSTALADASARAAGLPLAEWLDSGAAASVEANATIGGDDAPRMERAIAAAVADGYRVLKVKSGAMSWCSELDVLEAIATRWPTVRVRLDPNGAWDEATARTRLRDLEDLPIEYVEQPVAADAIETLVALADEPTRVFADESLLHPGGRARLAAASPRLGFALKPAVLGGPDLALSIVREAASHGRPLTVTTALDGAVGRAMAAHVAAVADRACGARAHGLATADLLARDVALTPSAPVLQLGAPGLGVEPDVGWCEEVRA